jgi:hypothetical protein
MIMPASTLLLRLGAPRASLKRESRRFNISTIQQLNDS